MIAKALELLLAWAWPEAPKWLIPVLLELVPEVLEIVRVVREQDGEAPPEFILDKVVVFLDEGLDHAPGWSDLSEDERDEALAALKSIGLFVLRVSKLKDQPEKRTLKDLRKGLRQARRAAEGK